MIFMYLSALFNICIGGLFPLCLCLHSSPRLLSAFASLYNSVDCGGLFIQDNYGMPTIQAVFVRPFDSAYLFLLAHVML